MNKPIKINTEVYRFTKGQLVHLDSIYSIQGLGGGDWWERTGADVAEGDSMGTDLGEDLIITRDIEISIVVKESA